MIILMKSILQLLIRWVISHYIDSSVVYQVSYLPLHIVWYWLHDFNVVYNLFLFEKNVVDLYWLQWSSENIKFSVSFILKLLKAVNSLSFEWLLLPAEHFLQDETLMN